MAALLKISALLSRSSHDKKGNNDQGQAHPLLGAKPFFEKQIADEYRQKLTTNDQNIDHHNGQVLIRYIDG